MTTSLSQYGRWFLIICCIIVASFSITCTPESTPDPKPDNPPETLLLKKITSGPQNIQTYSYSDQGLLTNFQSNWVYNDSLGTVSRTQAEFDYDTQQRLSQIRANRQYTVKFFYEGKLLDKSEEYDYKNRLVATHFYLFNQEGQLVELLDQIHDPYADKLSADQSIISELTMIYAYNAQGYPIRKTQQLTTAQPIPAITFDYHYE